MSFAERVEMRLGRGFVNGAGVQGALLPKDYLLPGTKARCPARDVGMSSRGYFVQQCAVSVQACTVVPGRYMLRPDRRNVQTRLTGCGGFAGPAGPAGHK